MPTKTLSEEVSFSWEHVSSTWKMWESHKVGGPNMSISSEFVDQPETIWLTQQRQGVPLKLRQQQPIKLRVFTYVQVE